MVVPPIVVTDGNDVALFGSIEEAEIALEPIDVRNNEYTIYDSEGRLLAPIVVVERMPLVPFLGGRLTVPVERVRIQPADTEPKHADALRQSFLSLLKAVEAGTSPSELEKMSLKELLDRVASTVVGDSER